MQWMRRDEEGRWVKYCRTCHVWRPPRASHCAVCGYCMVGLGARPSLAVPARLARHCVHCFAAQVMEASLRLRLVTFAASVVRCLWGSGAGRRPCIVPLLHLAALTLDEISA